MSKENLLIVKEVEDEDPEMWQFEHSAIIASSCLPLIASALFF